MKKLTALLLTAAMAFTTLAGCGKEGGAASGETMQIDFYNAAANYQGLQTG